MNNWKNILSKSVTTFSDLKKSLYCEDNGINDVISQYPMRINPYFLQLIHKHGPPIYKQVVPDAKEIQDLTGLPDPLNEEHLSPVPNLVHKYPDRVLFLVSNQCAVYCRFCTRKRKVGSPHMRVTTETLQAGINYIRNTPSVREVLLSGGDPLLLENSQLDDILTELRTIPSVEIIRIGTRIPSALPMRITHGLTSVLRKHHPLYINTHFNHPAEITPEAATACSMLADSGIPLGNHTVLLKGINNSVAIIRELMLKLLQLRIKPYYLFQADLTLGTNHFRTHTNEGIDILKGLIGHISGMGIPTFALDAPYGKGKIPITPEYIIKKGNELRFTNYCGELCGYPEIPDV